MSASPTAAESPSTLDVTDLPSFGFGHRSLMWWGTLGLMVIETTVFALGVMTYFYLQSHASAWPMSEAPPALIWGSINTLILLVSCLPNHWTKLAAEKLELKKVRIGIAICLLFALASSACVSSNCSRSTAAGTVRPTVPSSGCSWACTRRTC